MKPIPITAGQRIAEEFGYDQVVIVARRVGGGEHVTTYGVDTANCAVAARMGNFFKHKLMDWPSEEQVQWLDMATAPKDATMVRLLVEFDEGSFEDSSEACPTIGTNHFGNTGEDEWLFAGWDWTHDCFTQGTGKPIGWLPMVTGSLASGT